MREALGFEGAPRFGRDLYHAGVEEVRAALRDLAPEVGAALVLGHNPGWEEVVAWLGGEGVAMKTGCAALLSIDRPRWSEAVDAEGDWTLHDVIYPREL